MTKISFVKNIFASFTTSCLAFCVLEELQHQYLLLGYSEEDKKLPIESDYGFLLEEK